MGLEEGQRGLVSGAMLAGARPLRDPQRQFAVGLVDVGELLAGEERTLDEVDAVLDLAFVFGGRRAGRADYEAVVLGKAPVRLAQHGVVQRGLQHGGLEVVEHDLGRDAAETLEGPPVQGQPGGNLLVEDDLSVLVAAEREGQYEDVTLTQPPADGIEEGAGGAEVHLGLLAGGAVQAHRDLLLGRLEVVNEAADGGVGATVTVLPAEAVEDGHHLHALGEKVHHELAVGLDRRDVQRGFGFRPQGTGDGLGIGQRSTGIEEATALG
ncbi:MAG: hypothetical protein M1401_16915 [Chloroflexi bacterium]|nr:hypothetical protein [Chloroflexota bacterium]